VAAFDPDSEIITATQAPRATSVRPKAPAELIADATTAADTAGKVDFGSACTNCPLREQRTASKNGRQITIGYWETDLTAARPSGRPTTAPPARKSASTRAMWAW
jgi:hypothetical protein